MREQDRKEVQQVASMCSKGFAGSGIMGQDEESEKNAHTHKVYKRDCGWMEA